MRDNVRNLYKYGKRDHLQELLDLGTIRLSSALSFGEIALSKGAHDPEELSVAQSINPLKHNTKIVLRKNGREIKPLGTIKQKTCLRTDYYIYCLSLCHSEKMYDDFNADACVCIKDPAIFIDKVYKALDQVLPSCAIVAKQITYLDESEYHFSHPDVCFCKKDNFRYQKEFRFVCLPEIEQKSLQHIFINIGSIKNIANIYYIQ